MHPDVIKEEAERQHDNQCEYGSACPTRWDHIEHAYIPTLLREKLRETRVRVATAESHALRDFARELELHKETKGLDPFTLGWAAGHAARRSREISES